MKELKIVNLSKTYGDKQLFHQLNFSIQTGDRIGLIGPNGTGKSSLLKVIAGLDPYDEGEFIHPNHYTMSYLPQEILLDPEATILETIYQSSAPLIQLLLSYEQTNRQLEAQPDSQELLDQLMHLSDQMTELGGWEIEVQAKSILTRLGITDLDRLVKECSGGQQKRIAIAQALIEAPDLLILDEPTNHLDIESIQWLEHYLASYRGALLLVTHDRYFLDLVANQIVELRHGELTSYRGNYADYLEQRMEREQQLAAQQVKEDRLYRQELAWIRTGARARSTKQQARVDRFEQLRSSIQSRHQTQELESFGFQQQRIGNQIMELEDVSLMIGDQPVINHWTKTFVKGDRLGIVGANGVGKSTLLNALSQRIDFTSGEYIVGQTVRMVYYRQLKEDLPGDQRMLDYLHQIADQFRLPDQEVLSAAQLLERFNFPRHTHGTRISTLSGGEQRRLYLLSLLIQQPNVLLLDEPTNDLDLETLRILEDYLDEFKGVVIVVSHDRAFLDRTVSELLVLEGAGQFQTYLGNYSEYLDLLAKETAIKETTKTAVATPPKTKTKTKSSLTYYEKKEWATIEDDILAKEVEIETIQTQMNEPEQTAEVLMDLQAQLETEEAALLELYERYDYLSERA